MRVTYIGPAGLCDIPIGSVGTLVETKEYTCVTVSQVKWDGLRTGFHRHECLAAMEG